MLIKLEMRTLVGHFIINEHDKFHVQSELIMKRCYNLGARIEKTHTQTL